MIAQILAVVIFVAMFVLIVLEVWERHVITLGCGLLTLVLVFGLGNAQYGCSVGDLEFRQLFYKSFLVYGGTVRGDFQRN